MKVSVLLLVLASAALVVGVAVETDHQDVSLELQESFNHDMGEKYFHRQEESLLRGPIVQISADGCEDFGGKCIRKKKKDTCEGDIDKSYTCSKGKICCMEEPKATDEPSMDCEGYNGVCMSKKAAKKKCDGTIEKEYTCEKKKNVCCVKETPEGTEEPLQTEEPDSNVCNDLYLIGGWIKAPTPMTFTAAAAWCRSNNGQKLACPLDDNRFISWLQDQPLEDYVWFNGQQRDPSGLFFNYITWGHDFGNEISRYISRENGDLNIWNPTYPKYGKNAPLCVKGKKLLSTDDCDKPLLFYCSK